MLRASSWLLLILAAPVLAADPAPAATRPTWFEYDRSVPLEFQVEHVEERGDVTVKEVYFNGRTPKERVTAYLVEPEAPGPHPAVLYVHWLGDPRTTSKIQFLKEAKGLARYGVVSLLVDAMWSLPGWFIKQRYEDDYAASVNQVVELRRAMDALLAVPGVDPKRLAFVGHDFGAMYGILMGTVDPRPKTYVLMAGTVTFHEWYLLRKEKPKDKAAYVKKMEPLDPARWIGRLPPASVLLQFAEKDPYIERARAQVLIDAAKAPKLARFYATDHGMGTTDGVTERFLWLSRELELPAKPVPSSPDAGAK